MTALQGQVARTGSPALWVAFLALVLLLLAFDLRLARQRSEAQSFRSALAWSAFWIALSVAFGFFLWVAHGREAGLQFFAGYLLEKALSVDNLFVFVLIFRSFAVPPRQQHRVLFWGVLGALVLRGALIGVGIELVRRFHFVLPFFGGVLLFTAARLLLGRGEMSPEPTCSWPVRLIRRHLPFADQADEGAFFVRRGERLLGTQLLLALVAAESADLVFALDSIPAVFAVTDDAFLVFSSNVCAVLGLRALYFVVAHALTRARYLKPGLAAILLFVAAKMIFHRWIQIPTGLSLLVLAAILAAALGLSWLDSARSPSRGG